MPTPGPTAKTQALEPSIGPIPGPSVPIGGDVRLDSLSAEEIEHRLAARERDLKFHLSALRHEAATIGDDINIGGRPVMDIIRAQPVVAVGTALATGALLGALLGLRARAKRRPPTDDGIDFVRARLAIALEDAAQRVAWGADSEAALKAAMKSMPVIYGDSQSTAAMQARSSTREAIDVAVKSAVGFAAKAAVDQLTQKLTGHEETFAAVADAVD